MSNATAVLSTPPTAKARVKSRTQRSQQQQEAFGRMTTEMKELETKGESFMLQLAYTRGEYAQRIIKDKAVFGHCTIEEIASVIGVKRLTLNQCVRFSKRLDKGMLKELRKMSPPPPWRVMSRWSGIKDDGVREQMLKDIVSGDVPRTGYEQRLRKSLSLGPAKSKRPKKASSVFNALDGAAVSLLAKLDDLDRASQSLMEIVDTAERRDTRKVAKDALKSMKKLQRALEVSIKKCENTIS